ncbi:MAG TPA: 30S ribosome-binding factor RbfA [Oculatellaceae cyanobacterium]
MAGQRSQRVSQQIKRELSELIRRDLKDARIGGIVSITDVECSADCRSAKVFVSVFGNEEQKNGTIAALNDQLGYIRGELCRRLQLRFAPELQIKLDDSLERGAKVSDLLGKIARGEV